MICPKIGLSTIKVYKYYIYVKNDFLKITFEMIWTADTEP